MTPYNIILKRNGHIRNKWYMIIQVSIVLSGTVDRNWCFDNAHENDDHHVVKTLVAVNNVLLRTTMYPPDKSYSTLLKYYRQPKLSLAVSCAWKCLSLSAIKDINLLTDLTFSLQEKNITLCYRKFLVDFLKEASYYSCSLIVWIGTHT